MPKRDRIALELAEKNSKFYRDKKGQAIFKARCNIKTPKSVGNLGSVTPGRRLSTLSPAAQRLASSKLGIRIGTDKYSSTYNSPAYKSLSSRIKRTPSLVSTPNGKLCICNIQKARVGLLILSHKPHIWNHLIS